MIGHCPVILPAKHRCCVRQTLVKHLVNPSEEHSNIDKIDALPCTLLCTDCYHDSVTDLPWLLISQVKASLHLPVTAITMSYGGCNLMWV